jgi:hypothetical protein
MYLGVGISIALVVGIVGTVVALNMRKEQVGDPTEVTTAAGALKKITVDVDIAKLTQPEPDSPTGADQTYLEMVKLAVAIGDDFREIVKESTEPEKDKKLKPVLDKLLEAAEKGMGDADLDFDSVVEMTPFQEWKIGELLNAIGEIGTKAAQSQRGRDDTKSEKALRASLIWGKRLFEKGAYVSYKGAAMGVMSRALAEYATHFIKDPEKAATARTMAAGVVEKSKVWREKETKLVRKLNYSKTSDPGDLWNLAEKDEDRAWKAEGLMWLGVSKWSNADKAQRGTIDKYLTAKATDRDPVLAKRAKAALEYTNIDLRMNK